MPGGPPRSASHGGTPRTNAPRTRSACHPGTAPRADGGRACRAAPSRRPCCFGKPAAVIPIRPPSGVPSPVAPTWPRRHRRRGAPHRPAVVAGPRRRRRPPRTGPRQGRPRRHGGRLRAWRPCSSFPVPWRWRCARSPTPGSSRWSSRGRPWPRATPSPGCGRWRTSTSCSRAPTTAALDALAASRVAGGPRRRGRPVRHRPRPPRGALPVPGAALRPGGHVATSDRARPRGLVGAAPAARLRRHAGFRAPAGRGARRAGRPRRQAAPRLRATGLDRRPGHDRRRRRRGTAHPSTGSACAPWPGRRAASPSSAPRWNWPVGPASTRPPGSSRCRPGAGAATPCTSCCRSPGP